MHCPGRQRRAFLAVCFLLGTVFAGIANASAVAAPASDDPAQLLQRADDLRTADHAEFVRLLGRLQAPSSVLSSPQQFFLSYLKAWETGYEGREDAAIHLLDAVINKSPDVTLRFRAGVSVVNILSNQSRYEAAFTRLNGILAQLPLIADRNARAQAFVVASILYETAGQYELASSAASLALRETPPDSGDACKARYSGITALYKSGKFNGIEQTFDAGISSCVKAGNNFFANGLRLYLGSYYVQQEKNAAAIQLLEKNLPDVQRSGYSWLISRFYAQLGQAYWNTGKTALARQFSLAAATSANNQVGESLTTAYHLLYLISRQQGDMPAALDYHEKYMAADKGYLDEVSAKALAFQIVNQQVLAKKREIDALNKRNQILQLKQALDSKAAETNRLYLFLALTILSFILFWAYRVKRSQMSFMKLARRDGLTGIFNRQHFVASAEQQLKYCQKSGRMAGLIVIDLDHFKIVNDTHGHAVGDHILRRTVAACQAHLRSTDVFGRLGGEEFGILMPECDRDTVAGRAELIRVAIASVSDSEDARGVTVSASFGVAATTHSGYNLRQLLIHADKALYAAKREGRNRVMVSIEDEYSLDSATDAMPLQRR
jgi:diguanylate cyclase (GGDEF)-like protein